MPKFLCVEGVPGRPMAMLDADTGGRYIGMARKWNAEKEVHEEDCFKTVVPYDVALLKAEQKGDLKVHEKVSAPTLALARQRCGLDKPAVAKAAGKGKADA